MYRLRIENKIKNLISKSQIKNKYDSKYKYFRNNSIKYNKKSIIKLDLLIKRNIQNKMHFMSEIIESSYNICTMNLRKSYNRYISRYRLTLQQFVELKGC